jgi:hypothetical protein
MAAIVAGINSAKANLFKPAAVARAPKVKFLGYVNPGDNVLAEETAGFVEAAKKFFSGSVASVCWRKSDASVFYANDFKNSKVAALLSKYANVKPDDYAQKLWDLLINTFFSGLTTGDTLVFFLLTHGGINASGLEFILGGMNEATLTELAKKLPAGVNMILYNAGCEQSRSIDLPIHYTVDAAGRRIKYIEGGRKGADIKANVVTLTDTWSGYLSSFEPPTFYVSKGAAFTAIFLNFAAKFSNKKIKTVDELFTAYASSGWHALRPDVVPPGDDKIVIDNIISGKWVMFRPVIGLSSESLWTMDAPIICAKI